MQKQIDDHVQELEKQKTIFNILLKKEKETLQKKLHAVYTKAKLLSKKTKRKEIK